MRRNKVDFPQPLGPTRETSSPGVSEMLIPFSTNLCLNGSSGAGKLFVTSRKRSEDVTT